MYAPEPCKEPVQMSTIEQYLQVPTKWFALPDTGKMKWIWKPSTPLSPRMKWSRRYQHWKWKRKDPRLPSKKRNIRLQHGEPQNVCLQIQDKWDRRKANLHSRADKPDYPELPEHARDLTSPAYGKVAELLPMNMPETLGQLVLSTHYVHFRLNARESPVGCPVECPSQDPNFCPDSIDGEPRYKPMIEWENGEISSEPLDNVTADNPVCHTALSLQCIQEAIPADTLGFYHTRSEDNPVNILLEHWGYQHIWQILQLILYWRGDTAILLDEEVRTSRRNSQQENG